MERKIINVSMLNDYISRIFSAEELLHDIVILGEVSGFKISGQHSYFSLKDKGAKIDCSCFNYKKTVIPKDGDQILATGSVSYYAPYGRLSFIVDSIEPYGIGALALKLQKLKEKLEKEGYFALEHKKPIPKYPKKVCIITSKTGAVIKDIISTTRKYNKNIDLIIKDTKVQGIDADREIIKSLKIVDNMNYDVIIIARGGGSFEDLMLFNSEELIYAVYNAKTPIISAVGHETDFTLIDFVSDLRALTPTAAAEIIAYDVKANIQNIHNIYKNLYKALNNKISAEYMNLSNMHLRLKTAFNNYYSKNYNNLEKYYSEMCRLAEKCLQNKQHELDNTIIRLNSCNPTTILSKGYLYAQKEGQNVNMIKNLKKGDEILLKALDGQAKANIIEVNYEL